MPRKPRSSPPRDIARITRRGVTAADLERALGLSAGYLSKVRHGAVKPGAQLEILLGLLARHPTLAAELGLRASSSRRRRAAAAPARADRRRRPAGDGDRRAWELVRSLAGGLDDAGVRWAIGGAMALAAHGVRRPTVDVDLFIADADRRALELFREAGAAVGKLSSTSFLVFPEGARSPLDHVDVVFPLFEPLCSAVERPVRRALDGATLPFLDAVDLCAAKLAGRGAHDEADARALLASGAVDADAVRDMIAAVPLEAPALDRATAERRLRERA